MKFPKLGERWTYGNNIAVLEITEINASSIHIDNGWRGTNLLLIKDPKYQGLLSCTFDERHLNSPQLYKYLRGQEKPEELK